MFSWWAGERVGMGVGVWMYVWMDVLYVCRVVSYCVDDIQGR